MAKATDKAYESIRNSVLQGEFGSGLRLKESELAESIGVSRTPVREALRRLHAEGLIDFASNHRAAVARWSKQSVDDLFRMRVILEGLAAEMAAERISEQQIGEMSALAREMEKLCVGYPKINFDKISTLNSRFHQMIIDAAANKKLAGMMAGLIEMTIVLRTYQRYTAEELKRSFDHHRELVTAFEAGDSEWARAVMTCHILAARASYLRTKAPQDETEDDQAEY